MVWNGNDPSCRFAWHPSHVCINERGWPSNGGPCIEEARAQIRDQAKREHSRKEK